MLQRASVPPPSNPRPKKTVQLLLESRDPIGPSLRRLGNSDCIVVTFPRDAMGRVADWPELHRSGIYLLIAPAVGDNLMRIYVGQARHVMKRLRSHERDRLDPIYVQIAAIVSADNQMRDDMRGYCEQRFVWLLNQTRMVEVENCSPHYPPVRHDVQIVAEGFLKDALLLLGPTEPLAAMVAATIAVQEIGREVTGEAGPQPVRPLLPEQLYELHRGPCQAFAISSSTRGMRVLAGSRISPDIHYTLPKRGLDLRKRLLEDGTLIYCDDSAALVLIRDVNVSTPTIAANLVTGRRMDGYHSWKLVILDLEASHD